MREVMAMMQPDGIHPNAAGVAANVEAIGPAVLKLVARARAATVIRAFAALALPEAVRFELMLTGQGLPVPRPRAAGEPAPDAGLPRRDRRAARSRTSTSPSASCARPGFELALAGLGPLRRRQAAGRLCRRRREPRRSRHLQAKVETAARGAGVALPARRFVPHVTLARLPERLAGRDAAGGGGGGARRLPRLPAVPVEDFRLYRSHLGGAGPLYEELARYPLG